MKVSFNKFLTKLIFIIKNYEIYEEKKLNFKLSFKVKNYFKCILNLFISRLHL